MVVVANFLHIEYAANLLKLKVTPKSVEVGVKIVAKRYGFKLIDCLVYLVELKCFAHRL